MPLLSMATLLASRATVPRERLVIVFRRFHGNPTWRRCASQFPRSLNSTLQEIVRGSNARNRTSETMSDMRGHSAPYMHGIETRQAAGKGQRPVEALVADLLCVDRIQCRSRRGGGPTDIARSNIGRSGRAPLVLFLLPLAAVANGQASRMARARHVLPSN